MNKETQFIQNLSQCIEKYLKDIQSELIIRWNNWNIDYENKEIYEVVGGLISRQIHLTRYFLQSSSNWNADFGSIFLRTSVETHLSLAWILKNDSLNRSKLFMEYGLGQEKLIREKYKSALEKEDKFESIKEAFEEEEQRWDRERYSLFTDINLGAWSGISAYQMAKEIDDENFYNIVYSPFSNAVHSTWNHILKFNVKSSDNPLHGYIKMPIFEFLRPDIHYVELATKYMQMSFFVVDAKFPISVSIIPSNKVLFKEINKLADQYKSTKDTNN